MGESLSNLVTRRILRPQGVTFVSERAEKGREFLASTTPGFIRCSWRPVRTVLLCGRLLSRICRTPHLCRLGRDSQTHPLEERRRKRPHLAASAGRAGVPRLAGAAAPARAMRTRNWQRLFRIPSDGGGTRPSDFSSNGRTGPPSRCEESILREQKSRQCDPRTLDPRRTPAATTRRCDGARFQRTAPLREQAIAIIEQRPGRSARSCRGFSNWWTIRMPAFASALPSRRAVCRPTKCGLSALVLLAQSQPSDSWVFSAVLQQRDGASGRTGAAASPRSSRGPSPARARRLLQFLLDAGNRWAARRRRTGGNRRLGGQNGDVGRTLRPGGKLALARRHCAGPGAASHGSTPAAALFPSFNDSAADRKSSRRPPGAAAMRLSRRGPRCLRAADRAGQPAEVSARLRNCSPIGVHRTSKFRGPQPWRTERCEASRRSIGIGTDWPGGPGDRCWPRPAVRKRHRRPLGSRRRRPCSSRGRGADRRCGAAQAVRFRFRNDTQTPGHGLSVRRPPTAGKSSSSTYQSPGAGRRSGPRSSRSFAGKLPDVPHDPAVWQPGGPRAGGLSSRPRDHCSTTCSIRALGSRPIFSAMSW